MYRKLAGRYSYIIVLEGLAFFRWCRQTMYFPSTCVLAKPSEVMDVCVQSLRENLPRLGREQKYIHLTTIQSGAYRLF